MDHKRKKKLNNPLGYRTWYNEKDSVIRFKDKINFSCAKSFCMAFALFEKSKKRNLTLDFSKVSHAYPNGMLPIISTIRCLHLNGYNINVCLPLAKDVKRLFISVNWAHHLSPKQFKESDYRHDRHLVSRFFIDENEQHSCVNDFMDVILRTMTVPKDIISALEWSINEVTDNVLNHSQSEIGGIIQASTYHKTGQIAFAVADAGRGIFSSLSEGIPTLRTDIQAIGEAVKVGVTRNKDYGQGNGLAGALKATTLTGGSFEITSGRGRMLCTNLETKNYESTFNQAYNGTLIAGQINIVDNFSIEEALDFGQTSEYQYVNIIDTRYEMKDKDCLVIKMNEETTGFGTRKSGQQIRTKIENLLRAKPTFPLVIDWEGIPLISSSFADEVMGKLFNQMGALTFSSRIRNISLEILIAKLVDKAIAQRLTQATDK